MLLKRHMHSNRAGKSSRQRNSGKSLLLYWPNPDIFSKTQTKQTKIPAVIKWTLVQMWLTKVFQTVTILLLDLWLISASTSIINTNGLELILPLRLMFWKLPGQYRCPFPSIFDGNWSSKCLKTFLCSHIASRIIEWLELDGTLKII